MKGPSLILFFGFNLILSVCFAEGKDPANDKPQIPGSSEAVQTPLSRSNSFRQGAKALGREAADLILPKINFWYENEPVPLKEAEPIFGMKFRGRLGEYALPLWTLKTYRLFEDVFNPVIRTAHNIALPGVPGELESKVDRLIRLSGQRALEPHEKKQLEKYGAGEWAERTQRPSFCATAVRRFGSAINWGFRGIAALAGAHAVRMASDPGSTPSIEKALSEERYLPKDDEVQLWVETTPLPHLAIRIRDKIYSYGVTHMTASTPEDYLKIRELEQIRQRVVELYQAEKELDAESREKLHQIFPKEDWILEQDGKDRKDISGKFLEWAARALKTDKMERSMQVVTLRLGEDKVNELKIKYEMNRGKKYDNRTGVNDCATMVCRDIGLWNPLRDTAPGNLVTSLSLQGLVDPKVVNTFQIDVDHPENGRKHILRNAYINYLEGAFLLSAAWANLPERAYIEIAKKPEDLQWWTPESQAVFKQYRDDFEKDKKFENKINLFKMLAEQIDEKRGTPQDIRQRKESFLKVTENYFEKEVAKTESILKFVDSEQKERIVAGYRLEFLKTSREEIKKSLEFPSGFHRK